MECYKKKMSLWLSLIKNNDFSCFSSVKDLLIYLGIYQKMKLKNIINDNLLVLSRS